MRDLMIHDARPQFPVTYTARAGAIVMIDGMPNIVMRDGQVQRQVADGSVEVLDFERYPCSSANSSKSRNCSILKASDRYLYDLFFPDRTAHYDQRNLARFQAEGHARLASPLLNIALAMIALAGVLVGEFSRRGYARRMMIAAGVALVVRLLALAIGAAAIEEPSLNMLQYLLPIAVIDRLRDAARRESAAKAAQGARPACDGEGLTWVSCSAASAAI